MIVTIRKAQNGYILTKNEELFLFNNPKQYVAESVKDISKTAQKIFEDYEKNQKIIAEKGKNKS